MSHIKKMKIPTDVELFAVNVGKDFFFDISMINASNEFFSDSQMIFCQK